jgi:serine O-acetyltransferase
MICSCEVLQFYSAAENYALGFSEDLETVKRLYLSSINKDEKEAERFINSLPKIRKELSEDLQFFLDSDPAADSKEEIVLAYPGFKAIRYYRIAHQLYLLNKKLVARVISEEAHVITGVDIHPGAEIASPFFIDHATGIVIGETTVIGKRAKIYQCVTLGALSLAKGHYLKGVKRHPTLGNDVTIYAGVSILGGDVTIGNNVTIGSNVFLTESIPDNMRVTIGKPELVLQTKNK